jgi:hypothetical protein
MTEKSEDQVVWVCSAIEHVYRLPMEPLKDGCNSDNIPYVPESKYLALKSDLAVAVEALEELEWKLELHVVYMDGKNLGLITKEALGKIGGGK